jgi:hypothetical protein
MATTAADDTRAAAAVKAIQSGDVTGLRRLLAQHPELSSDSGCGAGAPWLDNSSTAQR